MFIQLLSPGIGFDPSGGCVRNAFFKRAKRAGTGIRGNPAAVTEAALAEEAVRARQFAAQTNPSGGGSDGLVPGASFGPLQTGNMRRLQTAATAAFAAWPPWRARRARLARAVATSS